MTDSQSASLSWCRAPIQSLWPDFFLSLAIAGFLMWSTLSDERMGLQFTCTFASRPCQSSDSWVEVPQNSRPYFSVSFETPTTWRARSPYLCSPGTVWPSYAPGHWVPICHLLRFAGTTARTNFWLYLIIYLCIVPVT
jgi:hypothetical protein